MLLLEVFTPDLFPSQRILHYLRVNSFAWLPIFFLGIGAARSTAGIKTNSNMLLFASVFVCFGMLFFVNANFYTWILMPIIALTFFMSSAVAVEKNRTAKSVGVWLGKMSPYIFVSHPIVLVIMDMLGLNAPLMMLTLLYVALFIALSFVYKFLHVKMQGCIK